MLGFQMPKSSYVSHEGMAPEGDDISIILDAAVEHTPDIAPIVALSVTTGARRGELVALRRSVVDWRRAVVHVRAALDVDDRLKGRRLAAVLAHRVVEISPGPTADVDS